MKELVRKGLQALGVAIVPTSLPKDMERDFATIAARCAPFTMTPTERLYGLYKAVEYVVKARIPGGIVECGVWRGGSCMAAALTVLRLGQDDRDIYLYDTFAGMTKPGEHDVDLTGKPALTIWSNQRLDEGNAWCFASDAEVRENMLLTAYPRQRLHFIKGDLLATIPAQAPPIISLLRLDTDFYETTKHALQHLFPRLAPGGVLIVDDYGHWQGARKAVDEYVLATGERLLLNRLDYSARIGVKA